MNVLFFLKPKSEVAYLHEDSTVRQALEKMRHYGYSAIPLIDEEGRYAGTVTEGDFLWYILKCRASGIEGTEHILVRDMEKKTQNLSVNVNAKLEDLLLMTMNQNFVPVTDDRGIFIGIVTRKDILSHFYQKAMDYKNVKA